MMGIKFKHIAGFLMFCAALALLPLALGEFELRLISQIACFSLFVLSFTILYGHAGLLSFGQAAYFGVGAYVCALAFKYVPGMPFLMAILCGAVAAGIAASLIGLFCVKLTGAYFSLLTVAFSQFLFAIAFKWRSVTGGDDGLVVMKNPITVPFIGSIDTMSTTNMYYLIILIVVVCFLACLWLTKTPFWNTIRCCKENEERASFIGYNTYMTKVLAFTIAGFFGGVGGALFAINESFVSTDVIDMHRSIVCLMMAFIGGANSIIGAIIGAAIYTLMTDMISKYTPYWELILGCLFIVIILFFRDGFVSLFPKARSLMMKLKTRT
jgi:branched-chain amino acid transport system permease protein